ncbi:MAG: hypothetical protein ACI4CS_09255 [Candidatus Weimeria sp.]
MQVIIPAFQNMEENMVSRRDLLHLSFYKKSPFLGSDGPLRYRIEKAEEEGGSEKEDTRTVLKVTIWPGPFSYDKTPEEKMSSKNFEFSEEALDEICDWISKKSDEL